LEGFHGHSCTSASLNTLFFSTLLELDVGESEALPVRYSRAAGPVAAQRPGAIAPAVPGAPFAEDDAPLDPALVLPPSFSKAFGASTIPVNSTTSLTFTIGNPNSSVSLPSIGFTDTLPSGVIVGTPNGLTGSCDGGTITAVGGSGSVSLSGATLPGGSSCIFSVNVVGTTAGQKNNSAQIGNGTPATASITVVAPPTISKAFGAVSILRDASTSLAFIISNPNGVTALSGVAFSDNLPAGLAVASPNGLTGSCGAGTVTATAGTGSISLAGGTLAAGGSCSVSVNVTGIVPGIDNNTTGPVTAAESGPGRSSNTASITVIGPPAIAKAFGAAGIAVSGTTTLTFTISNPNATVAMTGVAFADTLPGGLTVANPNGLTGSCGSGTITTGTVSGSSVVNLSGGTIPAGGACTFSVNVVGQTAGAKNNTTSTVTSSNAGSGNTASASVFVGPTPTPTLTPSITPTPTRTLTPTATPTATPFPRPNVGVQVAPGGGALQTTLTARDAGCNNNTQNNQLQSVQITRLTNATVDLATSPVTTVGVAPATVPLPTHPPSLQLTVHRVASGQAATVELTVTDGCGAWPTFVGGGPSAF
jgi:hypothetical protein